MTTLTTNRTSAPSDAEISGAIKDALQAESQWLFKAVLAGQMLIEAQYNRHMRHDGTCVNPKDRYKPNGSKFATWLDEVCPEISIRTAMRWRAAADRVMRIVTESHLPDPVVWKDFGGKKFYVSTVLSLATEDCSPDMLTFRETFERFLADKSLAEVTRCALNGCDEAHNIDRAANGKLKGGAGNVNRRDYARFLIVHFKEMSHLIGKWDGFIERDPAQFAKMAESLRSIILGGPVKIEERGRPIDMPGWPASFTKLLVQLGKERLSNQAKSQV